MSDQINIEKHNVEVTEWFRTTLRSIKQRYAQLVRSPNRSGDGLDSLKYSTNKSYGQIDRGGFKFERYLVFVHKGAGKGKGGSKGSTWLNAKGERKKTNPGSFGKMNTGNRKAEPWLNPVLDSEVPKLADIVSNFKADAAVKQIQIQ